MFITLSRYRLEVRESRFRHIHDYLAKFFSFLVFSSNNPQKDAQGQVIFHQTGYTNPKCPNLSSAEVFYRQKLTEQCFQAWGCGADLVQQLTCIFLSANTRENFKTSVPAKINISSVYTCSAKLPGLISILNVGSCLFRAAEIPEKQIKFPSSVSTRSLLWSKV